MCLERGASPKLLANWPKMIMTQIRMSNNWENPLIWENVEIRCFSLSKTELVSKVQKILHSNRIFRMHKGKYATINHHFNLYSRKFLIIWLRTRPYDCQMMLVVSRNQNLIYLVKSTQMKNGLIGQKMKNRQTNQKLFIPSQSLVNVFKKLLWEWKSVLYQN